MDMLAPEIDYIIYNQKQINDFISAVAENMRVYYATNDLLVITALKGALPFSKALVPKLEALDFRVKTDQIQVKSYQGTKSSGHVSIVHDVIHDIKGRDVVVVEDILDTGMTLKFLLETLISREPRSLSVAVLIDKPLRRMFDVEGMFPKVKFFKGISIDDLFVVGFGLDHNERYRELPYIAVLKKEYYQ